jgi:sulfur-oxidizing protein SoxY
MKNVFKLIIGILFVTTNLLATNPVESPMFDDIMKQLVGNQKYIFDNNIKVKVPKFADNPTQVPIFIDAKNVKNAKRMILFADLNPIPVITDVQLTNLYPVLSTNIKVAQETPLRVLVLDENNLWHVGSANIKSNGGGCDISAQASSNYEYAKLFGKTKGKTYIKKDVLRIKASIYHPMETGLVFGNNEYYINKIEIKTKNELMATFKTTAAISENPRLIFESKKNIDQLSLMFYDTDGNEFSLVTN